MYVDGHKSTSDVRDDFLSVSANLTDQSSFPTRRSSDLCHGDGPPRSVWNCCGRALDGSQSGSTPAHRRARGHNNSKRDRKSTRLNSSHVSMSYAVFCLKKKMNCYICTMFSRYFRCIRL